MRGKTFRKVGMNSILLALCVILVCTSSLSFAKETKPRRVKRSCAFALGRTAEAAGLVQKKTVERPEYLEQIGSKDDFLSLSKAVKMGGGEEHVVKVVFDKRAGCVKGQNT